MKHPFFLKVTGFFILLSMQVLYADWQWDNDLAVATLTPKGYQAQLSFQNNGKSDVAVTSLKFPCTCTVYHFTSTTAKPGETGTLTVVIEREEENQEKDYNVIVFGSPSTQPREVTIRIEKPNSTK